MLICTAKRSLGFVLAVGLSVPTITHSADVPAGDVLLSISGDITKTNIEDKFVLDRDMLTGLPATSFETSTIWTDGVHTFTGVSFVDLAAEIGAEEGQFMAIAINDYTVKIPSTDAVENGPIIAYQMDGKEMSVRDKGPLWVVYPYDSNANYRTEVIYSRSIWQLDRIDVVK
ncbi:oxidoreductase [Tateyamaria sp.]|uniref:oxidoreductase n=1 Tax=Tateyamaria sp. TaxID=1929288 RepID=UPI00329C071F